MRSKKWVWLVAIVGLALSVFFLVFVVQWANRRASIYSRTAAMLPEERAAARREGLPLTPDDLRRVPPVPPAQNAAPLYRQITQDFTAHPLPKAMDESVFAVQRGKANKADYVAARQALQIAAPDLRLAEQAAVLPGCDFQRDWSLGPDMKFPEYAKARELIRLLSARATLQGEGGDPEGALRTIAIGGHIAQHIGKDPVIIAMLVQIAMESNLDRQFQRIVKRYADRPDVLRLAAQADQAFGPRPDLAYSLRGEVNVYEVIMRMIRNDPSQLGSMLPELKPYLRNGREVAVDAFEARGLIYWRSVYAGLRRAGGDPMAEYRLLKALEAEEHRQAMREKVTYALIDNLAPVYPQASQKIMHMEAQRRLRRGMLALFAFRQHTGRFPTTLSELSPALPADPFDGQPLRYRTTSNGFVLYSLGENLVDDGGNATPKKKGDPPPDIVVAYP